MEFSVGTGNGENTFSGHGNIVPITVSDRAGVPAFGFTDPKSPYTNYTNNNTAY